MKIWLLGLLGTLALAGVFGWLFWRRDAQAAAIERLQAPQTTTVAVATIRPVALATATEYLGQTQAWREVAVTAATAGRVQAVLVPLHGAAQAGQPLLRLDAAAVRQSLAAARATLRKARLDAGRQQQLAQGGNTTQNDLENSRLQVQNATTQVVELEKQLREAVVRAPIGGTVSERLAEPGLLVQPGTALFTLTDVRALRLVVPVPEAELAAWRVGRRVPVRFEAFPGVPFTGTVHYLGLKGGEGGRFPVEVRVENDRAAAPLRVGLTARLRLVTDSAIRLLVPRAALAAGSAASQGAATVFVLRGGRVRRRPLRLGTAQDTRVAVQSGLAAGEQVVVSGTEALRDGQPVRVAAPLISAAN
jgi:RND family efflux transporter MFP subunit